jgi:hypothetical protein
MLEEGRLIFDGPSTTLFIPRTSLSVSFSNRILSLLRRPLGVL